MSCNFEANRKIVLSYFDLVFNQKDPSLAATLYLHEDYAHHGPGAITDRQDFILHFSEFFRLHRDFKADVLDCVSGEEMVALRVVTQVGDSSNKIMVAEFYRLEKGKIKEHWHVLENYGAPS